MTSEALASVPPRHYWGLGAAIPCRLSTFQVSCSSTSRVATLSPSLHEIRSRPTAKGATHLCVLSRAGTDFNLCPLDERSSYLNPPDSCLALTPCHSRRRNISSTSSPLTELELGLTLPRRRSCYERKGSGHRERRKGWDICSMKAVQNTLFKDEP